MGRAGRLIAWLGLGCAACAPLRVPAAPGIARVVFVGDSLVNRSDEDHGLLARVRAALAVSLPGLAVDLVNAGANGNRIADIRDRLADDVLALAPAAVVLYWDSDAADAEDAAESPARAAELRSAYERDLDLVLAALCGATTHVVVSGPTLMGERPHGRNPKDHVLDTYAAINHRLCRLHHATWVDTRRAAFRWLRRNASGAERDPRFLTEDGEHLSALGVSLVAEQIARALGRELGHEAPAAATPAEPEG